jgi:hypothetical protein
VWDTGYQVCGILDIRFALQCISGGQETGNKVCGTLDIRCVGYTGIRVGGKLGIRFVGY